MGVRFPQGAPETIPPRKGGFVSILSQTGRVSDERHYDGIELLHGNAVYR